MEQKKSFCVSSEILTFPSIAKLCEYLNPDETCLVITDSRIHEQFLGSSLKNSRLIYRDKAADSGPNSAEMISELLKDYGTSYSRVIGIGGGLAMDLAKILSLENILPVKALFDGRHRLKRKRELLLVPTTPGTGSEVTPFSAVFFRSTGEQKVLNSRILCADKALLCPEFLIKMPFQALASSSFDAFVHASESCLSPQATPLSRMLAEKALELLLRAWKYISAHGASSCDLFYEDLQTSGTAAGIAYSNTGTSAVHALAYPLTVRLHIPHGEACYLVFGGVFNKYLSKGPGEALDNLQNIISSQLNCDKDDAFAAVRRLCATIIQTHSLSSCGMTKNQIKEFADMVCVRQRLLPQGTGLLLNAGEIAGIYTELY